MSGVTVIRHYHNNTEFKTDRGSYTYDTDTEALTYLLWLIKQGYYVEVGAPDDSKNA